MFEEFKPEKLLELYYFPLLFPFHNEFVFIMPFLEVCTKGYTLWTMHWRHTWPQTQKL